MRISTTCFLIFNFILVQIPCVDAQTNGNMEAWSPSGNPPPFNWMYPTGWTTNNATTEFTTAGTRRSTDAHSGSYAAQMNTVNVFGTLKPAMLVLGNAMLDFPNYSVKMNTGGEPLVMTPYEISIYYKTQQGTPGDHPLFKVLVKRANGSPDPDTVYYQVHSMPLLEEYGEIRYLVGGFEIDPLTDSIVLSFQTNLDSAFGNNVLYIDDITYDFTISTETPRLQQDIVIFPNPVYSNQSFVVKAEMNEDSQVELFNLMGRKMKEVFVEKLKSDEWRITANGVPGGLYTLRLGKRLTAKVLIIE